MHFVVIHKASFASRPPVISTVLSLAQLGHKVTIVSESITNYWKEILQSKGVIGIEIPKRGGDSFVGKLLGYYNFRKKVRQIFSIELHDNGPFYLWLEGTYTMCALGATCIKKHKYILQIQELEFNSKKHIGILKKIIFDAQLVFMPEYNRTVFYQIFFGLKTRPTVLYNKPYFVPEPTFLEELKIKYKDKIGVFSKKKVVLYQGIIHKERDLSLFVEAIKSLGDDYQLVLLGKDYGCVEGYKKIDPQLIHIDFVPAPDYLLFTSLCYIGIVTYDPLNINTAYCAPNKIFEYGAFGKPMIGNNVPGLKYSIEYFEAGVLVEETVNSIQDGIIKISNNYNNYSDSAVTLYNSVDNTSIINDSIKLLR